MYFITQTIATVGYGDVNPVNILERYFVIITTYVGVIVFSFGTGSLGSILQNYDDEQADLNKKIGQLQSISDRFGLSE
jgi:hypothetical protein